jgi:hypothetical protein
VLPQQPTKEGRQHRKPVIQQQPQFSQHRFIHRPVTAIARSYMLLG